MLVDMVLVTLLQSSFYRTEHNSMYLFKGQAEQTCSLCLILGGL